MSPRLQVYFLGLLLIISGLALTIYKSETLGLPLISGQYETVWTVEAKVAFNADGGKVKASLALPKDQNKMKVVEELFSSSGYGFTVDDSEGHRRAIWTKRSATGRQALYYKLDVYKNNNNQRNDKLAVFPQPIIKPDWRGERLEVLRNAAKLLIKNSRDTSADRESFATQLIKNISDINNNNGRFIHKSFPNKESIEIIVDLFLLADIPAHIIRGIHLEDDRNRLSAQAFLEIFDGKKWVVYSPKTGNKGLSDNFLIWQRGDKSLLDIEGGSLSTVSFSIIANDVPAREIALKKMGVEQTALLDYSIYSLPIEQQSIFKFILLMPVGALIVIFLRVVVGVRTAGTFMPVLLAIAFVQTQLINGIVIFLLIMAIGLFVRSLLSRLDLLLVARISSVVVIVVALMAFISIISYKLGIEQALSITFFPMIIIAWSIEHMSILWEDDGPLEVCIQTTGSLVVATVCYFSITNRYIEHWMFNFPELLMVILGLIIILGHYTGYRVSELIRFRHMRNNV